MSNHKFLELAADLLDLAASTFSNHGYNNFKMTGRFEDHDLTELAGLMDERTDPEDITTPAQIKDYAEDWVLMRTMAFMLRKMADVEERNS